MYSKLGAKRPRSGGYNFRLSKKSKKEVINEQPDSDDEQDGGINPMDVFNAVLGEKIYRIENHIYFRDDVSVSSINKLGTLINQINREFQVTSASMNSVEMAPKPIYLHITSDGGDLFSGFMGFDFIRNSKIPVYTVVEGCAISAGSLMAIAGAKRYITENSYIMIHQLSGGSCGNYEQLLDSHANSTELMKRIKDIYKNNSSMSMKQIEASLKHDVYWNANKSIGCGLVDELYLPNKL